MLLRLEDVTAEIRPRVPWESIDLGCALACRHIGAIWQAWLITILPLWVLLAVLLQDHPVWFIVCTWWLNSNAVNTDKTHNANNLIAYSSLSLHLKMASFHRVRPWYGHQAVVCHRQSGSTHWSSQRNSPHTEIGSAAAPCAGNHLRYRSPQ